MKNFEVSEKVEVGIGWEHYNVHAGRFFSASYKTPDASPVADNAALVLHFKGGKNISHLVFQVAVGGEGEVELYEAPTASNNGTPVSVVGMNRASGLFVPASTVFHTPTVSSNGTLLINYMIPGGSNAASRVGGSIRDGSEWVLAANKSYLIRATNRSGGAQAVSIVAQWYEVGTTLL